MYRIARCWLWMSMWRSRRLGQSDCHGTELPFGCAHVHLCTPVDDGNDFMLWLWRWHCAATSFPLCLAWLCDNLRIRLKLYILCTQTLVILALVLLNWEAISDMRVAHSLDEEEFTHKLEEITITAFSWKFSSSTPRQKQPQKISIHEVWLTFVKFNQIKNEFCVCSTFFHHSHQLI